MKIKISEHFTTKKLIVFVLPSIFMMIITSIYGVIVEIGYTIGCAPIIDESPYSGWQPSWKVSVSIKPKER